MNQENPNDAPVLLVKFVEWYEADGSILCLSSAEALACCLRSAHKLPVPLELPEANQFIHRMDDVCFFLQPGLERYTHNRGTWFSMLGSHYVFVEPERPYPSRIKTVFHEIAEWLLEISHARHPHVPKRNNPQREKWANQLAAFVKMPADQFQQQFTQYKLDLEMLKEEFSETLAGVSRHIRDVILSARPYYYCRCDFVQRPERVCPKLLPVIAKTNGPCIVVKDLVRTDHIITKGVSGSLPQFNLPVSDHYRVMNSVMNQFLTKPRPMFFPSLEGGASDEGSYADLFGENRLCALIIPYGKRNKGFFLIAVHPDDQHLLSTILDRVSTDERGELPWLFSRAHYIRKHKARKPEQDSLPEIGGDELLNGLFGVKPYPWLDYAEGQEA